MHLIEVCGIRSMKNVAPVNGNLYGSSATETYVDVHRMHSFLACDSELILVFQDYPPAIRHGKQGNPRTQWRFNSKIIERNGGFAIATFGRATGYIGFLSFPRIDPLKKTPQHDPDDPHDPGLNFGTCAGTCQG